MSGYSIGEYIRNRRLYLSGLEVIKSREKVIDIACKYGYDTPESFTKAFTRFHGGISHAASGGTEILGQILRKIYRAHDSYRGRNTKGH